MNDLKEFLEAMKAEIRLSGQKHERADKLHKQEWCWELADLWKGIKSQGVNDL